MNKFIKVKMLTDIYANIEQGLRLDVRTRNRSNLLSDMTRVFRENGLSVARIKISTHGENASGTFYVTDATENEVDPKIVEILRAEVGIEALEVNKTPVWAPSKVNRSSQGDEKPRFWLGSLLWAQLEKLSANFGSSIKS